eukprot:359601-Chlamydomonas_euryale.AAC.4
MSASSKPWNDVHALQKTTATQVVLHNHYQGGACNSRLSRTDRLSRFPVPAGAGLAGSHGLLLLCTPRLCAVACASSRRPANIPPAPSRCAFAYPPPPAARRVPSLPAPVASRCRRPLGPVRHQLRGAHAAAVPTQAHRSQQQVVTAAMKSAQSVMLAIPGKRTDPCDLKGPLLSYVRSTYSDREADDAADDVGMVQELRGDVSVAHSAGSTPQLRDKHIKYVGEATTDTTPPSSHAPPLTRRRPSGRANMAAVRTEA